MDFLATDAAQSKSSTFNVFLLYPQIAVISIQCILKLLVMSESTKNKNSSEFVRAMKYTKHKLHQKIGLGKSKHNNNNNLQIKKYLLLKIYSYMTVIVMCSKQKQNAN